MSDTALTTRLDYSIMEQVIAKGDLAQLTPDQRATYYVKVCESLGLNPLTRPFEYIELNGKLTLYIRKDATDQIRQLKTISTTITDREVVDDIYVVTGQFTTPDGRTDTSIGAVPLAKEDGEWKTAQGGRRYFAGNGQWVPLRGEERANAMMKAETKCKRRGTLSIAGLGWLDESEADSIATARHISVTADGEIVTPQAKLAAETPPPAKTADAESQATVIPDAPINWDDVAMAFMKFGMVREGPELKNAAIELWKLRHLTLEQVRLEFTGLKDQWTKEPAQALADINDMLKDARAKSQQASLI